ncbi:hypothetical protein DFA_03334 [Cavenderia fasciculata]|uniref:F-box domain-containing protein n=1 Tax=Cavenderia fasciculata TaxID=261658 RepID=F4PHA4_CACFS|nr:uncharacterized protein DFA_03334 [Cavenderia fasciculata]EGG25088.1 hypothetical protein DFA_03334 [Cavenderia fasciculata]|eukprot:XP_004362939.1 hypothetical protein DFA_03334 [Cavenderia fasciculata]
MGWREELQSIVKDSKLSVHRLKSLSTSLVDHCKQNEKVTYFIDYYIKSIESTIRYCQNEHILNALYAVDLFMKDLSHSKNGYVQYIYLSTLKVLSELILIFLLFGYSDTIDKFKDKVTEFLELHEKKIMTMIPEEQCPKFIKLLEIWSNKEYYDQTLIRQWLNRMKREMAMAMMDDDKQSTSSIITTTSTSSTSSNDKLLSKRKHDLLDDAMGILMDIDSDFVNNIGNGYTTTKRNSSSDEDDGMHIDKKKKMFSFNIAMLPKVSLLDLPNELLFNIISNLGIPDLIRTSYVSRFLNRFIVYCPFWKDMSFEFVNNFSEFQVGRILTSHGSQVTTLNFNFSWVVNRDVIRKLAAHCTTLTSLSLEKCSLEERDIKLALSAPSLKHLNIAQNNNLGPNLMVDILSRNLERVSVACSHQLIYGLLGLSIYKKIKPSLKHLNIDCYCKNIIHQENYQTAIQDLVETNCNTLEKLIVHQYLNNVQIPPNSILRVKALNLWTIVKTNDIVSLRDKLKSISLKSLNKRYLNGNTALFKASEDSKIYIVSLLLEAGANSEINNFYGLSPILASPNVQTAKIWIRHGIQPPSQYEKDFLLAVPILEKYFQFLRPSKDNLHPTIVQPAANEEFNTLLKVLAGIREGQSSEILQQIKILVSSFLKSPLFFKNFLQTHRNSRSIVACTIGDDDFFHSAIMPHLKVFQQKRVLLDILETL